MKFNHVARRMKSAAFAGVAMFWKFSEFKVLKLRKCLHFEESLYASSEYVGRVRFDILKLYHLK